MATPERTPQRQSQSLPLFERALDVQPYYVLLFGVLWGCLLITGSALIHIDDVQAVARAPFVNGPPFVERQVGYVPALNWSVTYALLFPIALYLMLVSLQAIADALDTLHGRGMVRDDNMQIVSDPVITRSWMEGTPGRTRLLFLLGAIVPAIFSLGEWLRNNLLRLLGMGPTATYSDYDWGLAAVFRGSPGHFANGTFDLLAFCTEGLLMSASLIYFVLLLDLGRSMPLRKKGPLHLVPDLAADDPRRGFDVFEEPLQQMLFVALVCYLIFYLVRLEGAYLISTGVRNLGDFVRYDIAAGAEQVAGQSKITGNIAKLFDPGPGTFRGFLAQVLIFFIFLLCAIVIAMTVRIAAERARRNADEYFRSSGSASLFGRGSAKEQRANKTMTLWPLGYLKPNLLLMCVALAIGSLYFYRIGLYVAGGVLCALLLRLFKRLRKLGAT